MVEMSVLPGIGVDLALETSISKGDPSDIIGPSTSVEASALAGYGISVPRGMEGEALSLLYAEAVNGGTSSEIIERFLLNAPAGVTITGLITNEVSMGVEAQYNWERSDTGLGIEALAQQLEEVSDVSAYGSK